MSSRFGILNPLNGTSNRRQSIGKRKEESADENNTPSTKRQQTSYKKDRKMQVVYDVIVDKESKAEMTRRYGVPESTTRGWVKTASAYLDKAKKQGRSIVLTPEGFFENGQMCLDVWKTTGSQSVSKLSMSSLQTPSASISSIPTPDLSPAEFSDRIGYSDGASSSPNYAVEDNPLPLDLAMTSTTTASSLDQSSVNEEHRDSVQALEYLVGDGHNALDDVYRLRHVMSNADLERVLICIALIHQTRDLYINDDEGS